MSNTTTKVICNECGTDLHQAQEINCVRGYDCPNCGREFLLDTYKGDSAQYELTRISLTE